MKEVAPERKLEAAQQAVEQYLAHYPARERPANMRGALVNAYLVDLPVSDTALWLAGNRGMAGQRTASVGHLTIAALRQIGVLGEVMGGNEGLLVYPNAEPMRPSDGRLVLQASGSIYINMVTL